MTQNRLFSDQDLKEMGTQTVGLVERAIDNGDYEEAKRLARRMYREFSAMHDVYVNWVTAILTFVYNRYGDEALQDAQRAGVTRWITPIPQIYAGKDAKHRARLLVSALRGHLQPMEVREDDEKFIIMMHPCGSGARLVHQGAYEGPNSYAKIKNRQAMTFGRRNLPVYCAHCFMTTVVAIDISGIPVFVTVPGRTIGKDPCQFHIYKDPHAVPQEVYAMVGKEKPINSKK